MKNIFISSTFRDMQEERDLMQERVLPALRAEAKKYGDTVGLIDLRWGVDTSTLETDAGSAKVLKVCLDEIDRSHPYMLIFLGERYGWIPRKELIEEAVRGREEKFVTDDFEKSVTALEIEYGALSEQYGELEHCIVCIREPIENLLNDKEKEYYTEKEERGREKLRKLKERICSDIGVKERLITYSANWNASKGKLENFQVNGQPLEEVLTNRYIEMFQADWIEYGKLSWQKKEQLSFCAFMDSEVHSFAGREAILEGYHKDALNSSTLILRGEAGSGKTAIMCKLAKRLQGEGKQVFLCFSGTSDKSMRAEQVVQQMVYYLETLLGIENHMGAREEYIKDLTGEGLLWQLFYRDRKGIKYTEWITYLQNLCLQVPKEKEVFFCIDALEQLFFDEHAQNLDFFATGETVHMIATCADSFEIPKNMIEQGTIKDIPMLGVEDAKLVARGILNAYSRNQYDAIEQELLGKKRIGNPLYVSLLMQRLNMLDGEEFKNAPDEKGIIALGVEAIKQMPDEIEEAIIAIIQNGMKKISEDASALEDALAYLSVSRSGLRILDLQGIFNSKGKDFHVLDFTLFVKYLDSIFYMHEDGWIDFSHKGIRQVLLKNMKNRAVYEREVKEHIKTLEISDKLRNQEGMYFARIRKDRDLGKRLLSDALILHSRELDRILIQEAIADEGKFYAQLISDEIEEKSNVCDYLTVAVLELLGNSERERKARVEIAQALVWCKESVYKEYQTDKSMKDLRASYNRMRQEMECLGRVETALDYGLKALALTEVFYKDNEEKTNQNLFDLGYAYRCLADICYEQIVKSDSVDYEEKLQEAVCYSKKALTYTMILYEKDKSDATLEWLCGSYLQVANYLYILEQLEALPYYKMAWNCQMMLNETQENLAMLKNLADNYEHMGKSLQKQRKIQEALEYYKESLACQEIICELDENGDYLALLCRKSDKVMNMLHELGKYDDMPLYAEKSVIYAKSLWVQEQSAANMYNLSYAYNSYGFALAKANNAKDAVKYLEKATLLAEEIYQSAPTSTNAIRLLSRLRNLALVLLDLKCVEAALKYAKEAVEIGKRAYVREDSESLREYVMRAELAYVDALLMSECVEQSLELYQKNEAYSKVLYEKANVIQNARIYCKLLKGISSCYAKLEKHQEAEIYLLLAEEVAQKLCERSNKQEDKQLLEEIRRMKE